MNMREGLSAIMNTVVPAASSIAVQGKDLTKVYRFYASQRERVLDELGLYRWLPMKRRAIEEFKALDAISVSILRSERVGIIGRNGAGKTTLLKLITGNFTPTSGEITVNGKVQALMQTGLGFHPEFSGYQNICSSLLYNGLTDREFDEALKDVIDFVELNEFLHQPMTTYSQGMQARVQFAAATAIKPDILIVDEVLGAGDAYFSGKSAHRMERLAYSGCTLLLVSHSLQQILQFCERAVWLERGSIVMDGNALSVIKAYEEFIQRYSQERESDGMRKLMNVQSADKAVEAKDFVTPPWQQERFAAMLAGSEAGETVKTGDFLVSRWPGEPGIKITRVKVLDGDGRQVNIISSGSPLSIVIEITAEFEDEFDCRFIIFLMTLQGVGVCRHLSDVYRFHLARGGVQSVCLIYDTNLLAAGDYVFSAGVFKHYDPDNVAGTVRYDILSRSFYLKIKSRYNHEPGLIHHPGRWCLAHAK